MRICRFDDQRVGLVEGGRVFDATAALAALPALRWPLPLGDQLIAALPKLMRELEREYLVSALEAVQWKRVDAARSLGISRKTLWEKMKSYGLGDSE